MSPTNQTPLSDPSQKLPEVPPQQNSVSLTSASNGTLPVPSPVTNTVISIPNVVKPAVEKPQEGELYM